MPNVLSKLPEMPHDGDYSDCFCLGDVIWKPLPARTIAWLRSDPATIDYVKLVLLEAQLPPIKRIVKDMKEKIKFMKETIIALKAENLNSKPGNEHYYTFMGEDGMYLHPGDTYSVQKMEHVLEEARYTRKVNVLKDRIMRLLYNRNKEMATKFLNKYKLLMAEQLEMYETSKRPMRMYSPNTEEEEDSPTWGAVSYEGDGGAEQNYIKVAETIQDACNMFNNYVAILL